MATSSDARAVKSLNTSDGRRRFVFKTFAQRIEEVEIDVFRSLDPLQAEPKEGSSFFLDCLIQWRELNTAEDFISFYEEMLPLVQTLPQIILQKELIFSKLLSRLQMKGRLSLEPILRLLAALSRDLVKDFIPFLKRIADSLVSLLKNGADREPEIIEQIFTSWSYIMMYLQKYLVRDIFYVLKVTVNLRYYPKEYVQEFMAESIAFLLRNAPVDQLIKGIRKVMVEVVKKPLAIRKTGISMLLWYIMRGAPSRLHSRAVQVLRLLVDRSIFSIGDKLEGGSETVLEVLTLGFQRLCEELEPPELNLMWDCLYEEINDCITEGYLLHLSRLLRLLVSTLQGDYVHKVSDYRPMLELVEVLVKTFFPPPSNAVETTSQVITEILHLLLCLLDGLYKANDLSALSSVSAQWAPVFQLSSSSLLSFIKVLLLKDTCILHAFRMGLMSALNNLIEIFGEEVVCMLLDLCERLQGQTLCFLDGIPSERILKIHNFFQSTIKYWIDLINDTTSRNSSSPQIQENSLALLWGIIECYPYITDANGNSLLLLDLVIAIEESLVIDPGVPNSTWLGLMGAALGSYYKSFLFQCNGDEESAVSKCLFLAKKYKTFFPILSTVADILDSVYGSTIKGDSRCKNYHPELEAKEVGDALDLFAENLCHCNKEIRLSTLRILCHYEFLNFDPATKEPSVEKNIRLEVSEAWDVVSQEDNVIKLLLSIEATPLTIATSRKVILLISRIQMSLSAGRISEKYIPAVLNGLIGIFYNRFSYLWNPAMDCLAFLIGQYFGMTWDGYIQCLDHCESEFLTPPDECSGEDAELPSSSTDLVGRFSSFISPSSDRTPSVKVLSILIQTLEKVPSIAESRSRQLVPLFLKFLGYNIDDLSSVGSFNPLKCKGKEWKEVLKAWLSLFTLMRNPKSFYRGQFLKDVLQYRLLDEYDADLQMKVLDCLLNWKDDSLLPYHQHLKNLISAKDLREELTVWSLSMDTNHIDITHRTNIVPIVIRILAPKVRKLKTLASRKHASIHHRKAILGFIAQLDVGELPLFFLLLTKSLQTVPEEADATSEYIYGSPGSTSVAFNSTSVLRHFTEDSIKALSWKKRYGFLHVIEDILAVFDELHIRPFLDLLMGCVVRVLESCTVMLDSSKNSRSMVVQDYSGMEVNESELSVEADSQTMAATSTKQFKDLRSLCLKIISVALCKYEVHEFDGEFWDRFFISVKPLIASFKQEGASSEKPSALFSCFLAMSRSSKLVQLLYKEKNLIPDIFSMLTVKTASEAILSAVFKFTENLLELENELGNDSGAVKGLLIPHLDLLVCSLHSLFVHDKETRKLVRLPGEKELNVFKLLSSYINEPSAAKKFVDILLPVLARRAKKTELCVEILQTIKRVIAVLGSKISKNVISSLSPLLISGGPDVRVSVCDVLDALAQIDSSMHHVAKLLRELNATCIDGLDYDTILGAYQRINKSLFYSFQEEHALIILSHTVHDMSFEELILRQSAHRVLLSFVDFASEILDQEAKPDIGCWSGSCIRRVINDFLLNHMGDAVNKGASVQKLWIDLLREMVLKLPKVSSLASYKVLCDSDPDKDFFNNIIHLQKHRRARAWSRFRSVVSLGNLSEVVTNKVFIPFLFNMLFDVQDGKDEHLRSAYIEALASISGCMDWKPYYALLNRCFRDMILKPEKQKALLRLICSILDHFHFSEAHLVYETEKYSEDVLDPGTTGFASSVASSRSTHTAPLRDIQTCLQKNLLPKIQKLLASDSDKINVNISLVAVKLLKLLPGDIMDSQLPNVVYRISNFLKNRLESVRSEARSALAACMKELGMDYLQFIIKVLRSTLKRGFELHVLGYTLNYILSKFLLNPAHGKLDHCLEDVLSVAENDILGDVSEQKEVDKIASKMKETKKQKSFETLKLIAQNITFKTHALKLLSPVAVHLQKQLTPRVKLKLENMLSHIAAGIECNPSVNQTDLFIFTYGLIQDGLADEADQQDFSSVLRASKHDRNEPTEQESKSDRLIDIDHRYSHLITAFALGVLQNFMKRLKLNKKDEELLSMLDPFIRLLGECLSSKYENITSAALRCLSLLVKLPLPSLESQADNIKNSLLMIVQGSMDPGNPLIESCLRLLIVLLRSTKITLSSDQLHMLIQSPLFVDLERNPSFIALSLLKAILTRKLVVPEIYDMVKKVAELMVTSQVEPVRKKCSQILLQFLLDYRLSEKRLQQHLDFLFANLRYEHATGREAVLEMLHTIILKFPVSVVDDQSQTVFLHLVVCLANDHDNKVRSMTGAAIKLLIGRVSPNSHHSILEYTLSWYLGGKQHLLSAAAQVLGLLVEVMKKAFQKHINGILPAMRKILQSAANVMTNSQIDLSNEPTVPFWKEAYYSLILLEKILQQFPNICFGKDLEAIWEIICELLLHPHLWLRKVSSRLLALYFSMFTEARRENHQLLIGEFFLMRLSRLFFVAVSLSCQLKVQLADDSANTLIAQNLAFVICCLHDLLKENDHMDFHKMWSTIEEDEQGRFAKALNMLDPKKGRSILASLTSDSGGAHSHQLGNQYLIVSCLLKRLGKISLQMEDLQMKIIFNCFKAIAPKLLAPYETLLPVGEDESHNFAYQLLLPLYKVCEGYAGKVISDEVKQLANEVRESMSNILGKNFALVYSKIMKNLKTKRERRKQEEKLMAVINPMRNAKRKLRIAAKHRANKKRKLMTMKMARWIR